VRVVVSGWPAFTRPAVRARRAPVRATHGLDGGVRLSLRNNSLQCNAQGCDPSVMPNLPLGLRENLQEIQSAATAYQRGRQSVDARPQPGERAACRREPGRQARKAKQASRAQSSMSLPDHSIDALRGEQVEDEIRNEAIVASGRLVSWWTAVSQPDVYPRTEAGEASLREADHHWAEVDGGVRSGFRQVRLQKRGSETTGAAPELEDGVRSPKLEVEHQLGRRAIFVERLCVLHATDTIVDAARFTR
jgi:hypothetical protein